MATHIFPVPKDAQSPGASDVKWFAGLAMQAIITKQATVPDTEVEREEIALWSFRMGQAMTAAGLRLHVDDDARQPQKKTE